MKKTIYPGLLAASISAILFPLSVYSAPPVSSSANGGNTINWQGDGTSHNAPLIEISGVGNSVPHVMNVDNVVLDPSFTSSSAFAGMRYKAGISLAGNNGSLGLLAPQNYGDISLNVTNSSITGSLSTGPLSGLYLRTDTAGATSSVYSNSAINVSTSGLVFGMLVESFGAGGIVDITLANGSDIDVTYTGSAITSSSGIVASASLGTVRVLTEENTSINVSGDYVSGIRAGAGSGGSSVLNQGSITVTGQNAAGINASASGTGTVNVINRGTIIANGPGGAGIYINNSGSGLTLVTNDDHIQANGTGTLGIDIASSAGNVQVINNGTITTVDNKGIYARSSGGNVLVQATNNITTGQSSGTTHNHGIDAAATGAAGGNVGVHYDAGTIKVVGVTGTGGNTIGIASWDAGSGNSGVNAEINLGSTAIIDATEGVGGLQIRSNGTGTINIDRGAEVHGGTGYGINMFGLASSTAGVYELNNAGWIDSMNDRALSVSTAAGSDLAVNNSGTIDGYFTLSGEDSVFNNLSSGIWNIRNFADTNADQIRDEKDVAVSQFGTGYDVFKNETGAMVRLSAVTGETSTLSASQYITGGTSDITNSGTVQGQLLNLERFENRGVIDLSENQQAGDVLVITGNNSATGTSVHDGGLVSSGGGQFVSDGGFVILDTVLNNGGTDALSDVLVIDDAMLGSGGATQIMINRVDGLGSVTSGDGIKVIEVLGNADVGSFRLAGSDVVKAGIYEYTLHQGAISDPANNSLFLRATAQQINPDVGAYLANQTAATGLFMHSLHDRLGEPQYYQGYKSENKSIPALWLRGSIGHSKNEAADGNLKQSTDDHVIHLGGEIANWSASGNDRYHLGLMGAYGRSETETKSKATGTKSDSTVDGYGVGAYLTWYSNEFSPQGWYADVWTMYGWFDNETDSSENYDSKAWTTSVELGYAAKLRAFDNYDWMFEPQLQVAYHYYSASDIKDRGNSLTIDNSDADGISTRLGMRTYLRPSTEQGIAQPFLELNWLYNSADNSMDFNGETLASDMPENRFETKIGVQGEVTKNLQFYGHVGYQFGQDSYNRTEGQIGLRYRF